MSQTSLVRKKKPSGAISRRVARGWFIWSSWSVRFIWFDERERQNRPAHQIDCQEFAVLRFAVRVCRCHLLSFLYLSSSPFTHPTPLNDMDLYLAKWACFFNDLGS